MKFWKMEGLGNDFVMIPGPRTLAETEIAALCDRRRGVGADGVLVVTPGDGQVGMAYFNADGSAAEMCGNGLRCVARLAVETGMVSGSEFSVETPVGPRRVRVGSSEVTAELGPVTVGERRRIGDRVFRLVSVGNPHAVTWADDPEDVALTVMAESLQDRFPAGVNVEVAAVESSDRISMRVWERGVGETAACGTGAVAAVAAGVAQGLVRPRTEVMLRGGRAEVELGEGTSWITGPARLVYRGEWIA